MADFHASEDPKLSWSSFFTICSVIIPPITFCAVAWHYFDVQGLHDGAKGPDVGPDLFHPLAALVFGTFAGTFVGAATAFLARKFCPAFAPRFTATLLTLHCVLLVASGGRVVQEHFVQAMEAFGEEAEGNTAVRRPRKSGCIPLGMRERASSVRPSFEDLPHCAASVPTFGMSETHALTSPFCLFNSRPPPAIIPPVAMSASRLLLIGLLVLFTGAAWYFGRPNPADKLSVAIATPAKPEVAAGT